MPCGPHDPALVELYGGPSTPLRRQWRANTAPPDRVPVRALAMAPASKRPPCGRSVGGLRPPPGAQVSAEQALAVQSALLRFGRNASLLVFGLGNDAPMWHNMTGGRVASTPRRGRTAGRSRRRTPWSGRRWAVAPTDAVERSPRGGHVDGRRGAVTVGRSRRRRGAVVLTPRSGRRGEGGPT